MKTNNSSFKKNVTIVLDSNYSEAKTVELGQSLNLGSPGSPITYVPRAKSLVVKGFLQKDQPTVDIPTIDKNKILYGWKANAGNIKSPKQKREASLSLNGKKRFQKEDNFSSPKSLRSSSGSRLSAADFSNLNMGNESSYGI